MKAQCKEYSPSVLIRLTYVLIHFLATAGINEIGKRDLKSPLFNFTEKTSKNIKLI
jgi:hypothetical protein